LICPVQGVFFCCNRFEGIVFPHKWNTNAFVPYKDCLGDSNLAARARTSYAERAFWCDRFCLIEMRDMATPLFGR
jgi:hypothetical protein